MNYLEKNLAALEKKEPDLARRLRAMPDNPNIRLEKNGTERLMEVKTDDGRSVVFRREIASAKVRKITERKLFSFSEVVVLVGAGLGETLIETLKASGPGAYILLVEADISIFKKLLEGFNLSEYLSDPRAGISVGENPVDAVMVRLEEQFGVFTRPNFQVIKHSVALSCFPEYYARIDSILEKQKRMAGNNLETISRLSGLWQKNIFENMPYILSSPGIRHMFGKMKNIPAIIVAAGPSLDKNCRWLEKAGSSMVIISVDTSLKTLLKNNVRPHFVVSLDALLENYSHLHEADSSGYTLVVNPVTYPMILKEQEGPMLVTSYSEPLVRWLEKFTGDMGVNVTGGSVATSAFDFARRMGCSPIILTGQDLAFTGGRTHSSGGSKEELVYSSLGGPATYSNLHSNAIDYEHRSQLDGNLGHRLESSDKMNAWKAWFEIQIQKYSVKCVNATEGGAEIEGALKLCLQEAVREYGGGKTDIDGIMDEAHVLRLPVDTEMVMSRLGGIASRSREIKKMCSLGTKEAEKVQEYARKKGSEDALAESKRTCIQYIKLVMKETEFLDINHWRFEKTMDQIQRMHSGIRTSDPAKRSYIEGESYILFFKEVFSVAREFEKNVKIVHSIKSAVSAGSKANAH